MNLEDVRQEALAGKKAMEAQKPWEAHPHFVNAKMKLLDKLEEAGMSVSEADIDKAYREEGARMVVSVADVESGRRAMPKIRSEKQYARYHNPPVAATLK